MKFDLHLHTYYSDGKYGPRELVELAIERKLSGIAITDHDTILGIQEAICKSKEYDDFKIIPGIEFGCIYEDEEVHILGYFIDLNDVDIIDATKQLKKARENRGKAIIEKLKELGLDLSYEEVINISKENFLGRVPIAKVLVKKAYVSSINEAFNIYLDRGKPGYVEKESLSVKDTIKLIKKANGIPVLAHPGLLKNRQIIKYCIDNGIEGIECIHSKHTLDQMEYFKRLATSNSLIITGGSDCHGELINGELLLGKYSVDLNFIPEMKERIY